MEDKQKEGKCPVCGEDLIYPRGDTPYCEECGWNCDNNKEKDCFEIEYAPGAVSILLNGIL